MTKMRVQKVPHFFSKNAIPLLKFHNNLILLMLDVLQARFWGKSLFSYAEDTRLFPRLCLGKETLTGRCSFSPGVKTPSGHHPCCASFQNPPQADRGNDVYESQRFNIYSTPTLQRELSSLRSQLVGHGSTSSP